MKINYNHLRYFWFVAREGHLGKAAERLHISPSALSIQLKKLEERLGQDLFERQGRGLQLTEAGRLALATADQVFTRADEMLARLQAGRLEQTGRVRLGAVSTLSRNFLELFLEPLLERRDVFFSVRSGQLNDMLADLARHELDLVLTHIPVASEDRYRWRSQRLGVQPVSVIGRPGRAGVLRVPEDLDGEHLLLPGPSTAIRNAFDLLCESRGVRPRVLAEVDDMAMLRLLARDAKALAVLPGIVVRDEISNGQLVEYGRLDGIEEQFFAVSLPREHPSKLAEELVESASERLLETPSRL